LAIKSIKKNLETLRKIYSKHLTVELIAEELSACSPEDNALTIKFQMEKLDFDYYGVAVDGKILGYIIQSELDEGLISEYMHTFQMEDLVSESTSLLELLLILRERHPVFILESNRINKLITVADLQKQPIRMLIFGLISILEMNLVELIMDYYPNEQWKDRLSDNRINEATKIFALRKEKNEGLGLIDCIQLADKGMIVQKTPDLLEKLEFPSRREAKQFFNRIEELRNNTAHSQEYVYSDFNEFLDIIARLERVLGLI